MWFQMLVWVLYRLLWPLTRYAMEDAREQAADHFTSKNPDRLLVGRGVIKDHAALGGLMDASAVCGLQVTTKRGGDYPADVTCRTCRRILKRAEKRVTKPLVSQPNPPGKR